jgi:diguanylate cyclase (GGDEF)-like protein
MPDSRRRLSASRAFAILIIAFAAVFGAVVAMLAIEQHRVLETAERLQTQTVPEIIRYQRLARNIEQVRQEGEHVFSASTPEARQQSLFLIMVLSSHPSILEHAKAAEAVRAAENFLVETGRLALEDPRTLRERHAGWHFHSSRLSLLVDDLSVQGASLATSDLGEMSSAMRVARYKLMGALALVGAFLVLMLILFGRYLIGPLRRIDGSLSSLDVDQPAPTFPPGGLAEIHAIEEATRQLHRSLVANDAARRDLEKLANRDSLTGLMNRRHFLRRAETELRRAERYERPIVVALGDLDNFKQLNDTYGHAAGDIVLRTFAAMLEESVRQSDIVCRYGGEEFAFIFPECSVDQARVLLERFREGLADTDIRLPTGIDIRVTISIGLTDASGQSIDAAIQQADFALYEAKRLGRNRVAIATPMPS